MSEGKRIAYYQQLVGLDCADKTTEQWAIYWYDPHFQVIDHDGYVFGVNQIPPDSVGEKVANQVCSIAELMKPPQPRLDPAPEPPEKEVEQVPDFGPYIAEMQRRIKRNWSPPPGRGNCWRFCGRVYRV